MTRKILPQDYIKSQVLLDDFEDLTKWTATYGTIEANTEQYKTGNQSMKVTSRIGNDGVFEKENISLNLTGNMNIWVYVHDISKCDYIAVYVSSIGGAWSKYFSYTWGTTRLVSGWNLLVAVQNKWTVYGGESWNNTMVRMRLVVKPVAGQVFEVTFDSVYINVDRMESKVLITFDDGRLTQYTQAYSYMAEKGLRGTCYIISDNVGKNNVMDLGNLYELYAAGWAIGNHTVSHQNLTTLSETEMRSEIIGCTEYLIQNNMPRAAYHMAQPYGQRNAIVDTITADCGMLTSRTVENYPQWLPPRNLYSIKGENISKTTTLGQVKGKIDTAINEQSHCILLFHDIVETPINESEWSITNFQALIDYIVERNIDVVTIDEWYEGLTNPRYRSLPLGRATV